MSSAAEQNYPIGKLSGNESECFAPNYGKKASGLDKWAKLGIAVQAFCIFIISLDMTILMPALPTVSQALHATSTEAFWIIASYLFASAVCQPMMAALAEAVGQHAIFLGSVTLFTIGSVICSVAPDISSMLAGRTVQGLGGGGIINVNLIIISDLVPTRQFPKYQAYTLLVFALGTNIAPVLGGAFAKTQWRWIFYINLPFCGIALVAIALLGCFNSRRNTGQTQHRLESNDAKGEIVQGAEVEAAQNTRSSASSISLYEFDWVGSALMITSSTIFLIGMSWGGNQYPWVSVAVLVPTLSGVAMFLFTIYYERFRATKPFLRISIFLNKTGIATSACTLIQSFLLFAITVFLPRYLQVCKLYSPLLSGVGLIAFGAAVIPVSVVTGLSITKYGYYRWALWLGWAVSILGLGLLTTLDVETSTAAWVFISICAGVGQGLLLVSHLAAMRASCSREDKAFAVSMYAFLRSFGLALAVILSYAAFQNFLRTRLLSDGLPAEIASDFEGYVQVIQGLPADSPEKLAIQLAYAWAFKMLFATLTGICGFGGLLSLFVEHLTTDH